MEPIKRFIPKDGPGPRGAPECYYTSRVLDSTSRYVRFVKKLREEEEDTRLGNMRELLALKDKQYSEFFIRCDRKSLLNQVSRRVELCLESYEKDLVAKRARLLALLEAEEEENIRKFVVQAQAGAEAIWEDKKARLAYLLAKRKKEHEERYKDTPLSKSPHARACVSKFLAEEAAQIQLYQIKEKQARKMAEKEFDKMWHEVAMKESEALAARMEYDAMERLRREQECHAASEVQLELKRQRRQSEREMLKREAQAFKERLAEMDRKEDEAQQAAKERREQVARDSKEMLREQQELARQQEIDTKLINDTWDYLVAQSQSGDKEKEALVRRKRVEQNECNQHLISLKASLAEVDACTDACIEAERQRLQDADDKRRCAEIAKKNAYKAACNADLMKQIKEREVIRSKVEPDYFDIYSKQLFEQMQKLIDHKMMTDAQAKIAYGKKLLEQIKYNKKLQDIKKQEELDQIEKCKKATEEFDHEVGRMLCRESYSEKEHAFMKQMRRGLKMKETCVCSKPTYCGDGAKQHEAK